MANTKRNLSIKIKTTCSLLNTADDCIMGKNIVEADQTKEIRKIFRQGISRNRKIVFLFLNIGRE